jgi:single-strand DNA-binding protein
MIKATVIGRLGEDARNITLEKGSFISMRVASNEKVNKQEVTTWISVYANTARYANMLQYLKKGTVVAITGSMNCEIYTAKDGKQGIDYKLNADSINFLNLGGNKSSENGQNANANTTQNNGGTPEQREQMTMNFNSQAPSAPASAQNLASDSMPFDNDNDNIPF